MYWIPVLQILEAHGMAVVLVNARHVRSVPGRKSDVADCEWLRNLHAVLRHRDQLVKAASRSVLHMQKAFDQMNIHVHHALSSLSGQSGLRITDAILAGERDAGRLADLADRRVRASHATLSAALEGDWRVEHLLSLRHARRTYGHYQQQVAECEQEIERMIGALESPPPAPSDDRKGSDGAAPAVALAAPQAAAAAADGAEGEPAASARFDLQAHLERLLGTDLTRIPGIGLSTAQVLFAELGADLSRFPSCGHFASWLGLCPQNKVSGGRIISARTRSGTNRAAQALRWATQSLYRSPTALGESFRRKRARLGTPQAITATAHKLARVVYHLVTHRVPYDDSIFAAQERQHVRRQEKRLRN